MGHREELLDGAAQCLYEKGFGRTTARDVVAASGTNLASIGYHFGSKDALLTEALLRATTAWGEELDRALAEPDGAATSDPDRRVEDTWGRVISLFSTQRRLWATHVEALAQAERLPELRAKLAEAQHEVREGLALTFHTLPDDDPAAADRRVHVLGAVYQALLTGVMVQWMLDPESAPSGVDLAEGLRAIVERADALA
ncbi:Transcriptional regulator, TetR family [Pseudonocardia sp. Ae168_Ps1]|uniref:TetR/AcrR family transcriptional regulator n=1 Tax=unclassified Pseudonocardia TaxID=2619320 RepID=UPI0001FFE952|nr:MULTISPECIES: TetR/AcrR family transcriptional regulator [unclassified Pseudonocardia]ALE75298.1 TetR family transcriptional regulator [Pseudonocardia sp. EC080625-04]ALL74662.1 TetR family transcriptional regulator [Pseudonocardia sp. EC080610-09]ALL81684.1 TetR family transcriptional regulator [Pseudonocardia sp. EC080619-01]OLL75242.1 Transcriptional regulator, TetR family [Pseudonocardia sp. Ae150A_Ps1]OLL81236.1 Transcriptional regulator, TetR family [Pseudonocardia sp. Ae168_Ps1]